MPTYTILRNSRTALYEMHMPECRHSNARHMEKMANGQTAPTAIIAVSDFEWQNDGCLAKIAPCAKGK